MKGRLMSVRRRRGELVLGALGRLLEPLERHLVRRAGRCPSRVWNCSIRKSTMRWSKSSPPRIGVAVRALHLEHAVADLEDRDVEGAAAEVEHRDASWRSRFAEAVGERGGRGLVDDAQHVQAGDLAGVLGGLALRVVEVGGHGDHRVRRRGSPRKSGGDLAHLREHHRGDLLRRAEPVADADPGVAVRRRPRCRRARCSAKRRDLLGVVAAADQALRREHGAARVRDGLALGDLARPASRRDP